MCPDERGQNLYLFVNWECAEEQGIKGPNAMNANRLKGNTGDLFKIK